MSALTDLEIWREIPPEEKLEIMSRSQASGITASSLSVIVCATLAIALQHPWVFWSAIIFAPFTFQFTSNKSWRALRPSMVLQYLAVRSVSRRYAYSAAHSKDLALRCVFPATAWRDLSLEEADPEDEDKINKLKNSFGSTQNEQKVYPAWVALFTDAVTIITEGPGGAKLLFATGIGPKISISSVSESGGDYDSNKEVLLEYQTMNGPHYWRIRSKFPAALIVFEKQCKNLIIEKKALLEVS